MKLKIKNALIDGFNSLKTTPVVLLVGLISSIIIKLLEPRNLVAVDGKIPYNLSDVFFSYGGLNLIAVILVSIFINGLIIVLVAKGKKFSLTSAINLVASKFITLLLASVLSFIIIALGLIALVLPAIFLSIRLLYFEQAVLLNGKGVVGSLKMSWNLTKGNWWRIFALVVSIMAISLIISVPINLLNRTIGDFLSGILLIPWIAAAYTKSYLQLKR